MEFRITLDREAFKVLASDTRLDILKALDERPMTVSELGRKLDLNKATVFEHLEKLVGAGLVKKQDDDRMWVYYSLSWKARRILHPERVTIALLFSTALGALLSGITVAAEYARQLSPMDPRGGAGGAQTMETSQDAAAPALRADMPADAGAAAASDQLLLLAVALFITVAVLVGIGLYYWRQAKQRDAAEAARTAAPKS